MFHVTSAIKDKQKMCCTEDLAKGRETGSTVWQLQLNITKGIIIHCARH